MIRKVFIFFVIFPVALAFLNWIIASRNFLAWTYHRTNEISMVTLFIAFLGSLLTIYLNHRSNDKKKVWYILPTLTAIISIGYWYIIKSLSNFGF